MNTSAQRFTGPLMILLIAIITIGLLQEVSVTSARDNNALLAKDRKEVEAVINNVFGWAVTKDFDLFFRSIADDSDFVSVTPYKRVKFGVEDVKKDTAFWSNPDFKAIRHELHDLRIKFSRSGDVAWFYCVLDDINELNGQPANWENVRWTGVVEKRQGKWRIVQQHFSYAQQ